MCVSRWSILTDNPKSATCSVSQVKVWTDVIMCACAFECGHIGMTPPTQKPTPIHTFAMKPRLSPLRFSITLRACKGGGKGLGSECSTIIGDGTWQHPQA